MHYGWLGSESVLRLCCNYAVPLPPPQTIVAMHLMVDFKEDPHQVAFRFLMDSDRPSPPTQCMPINNCSRFIFFFSPAFHENNMSVCGRPGAVSWLAEGEGETCISKLPECFIKKYLGLSCFFMSYSCVTGYLYCHHSGFFNYCTGNKGIY